MKSGKQKKTILYQLFLSYDNIADVIIDERQNTTKVQLYKQLFMNNQVQSGVFTLYTKLMIVCNSFKFNFKGCEHSLMHIFILNLFISDAFQCLSNKFILY